MGLASGFALLFGKLFPDRAGEDLKDDEKARLALAELSGKQGRLLVIDNVEDAASVRPFLPGVGTGCRTLITSRFTGWPGAEGIRPIPLDVLEPESSRQFLLARTGRAADTAELSACDDLARVLGYLPLALEQAAAYIAVPGAGIGFADYLRLYEAAAADLLSRKALGSTEYPDAVITTWQTTVEKLSPESRAVLCLCSWSADTQIPRVLVMEGAEEVLALAERFGPQTPLAGFAAPELRMRDALTGLARYSMILDANDETFRVHGLVQTVERVRAEEEGREDEARDWALERLTAIFPYAFDDPAAWPLCRRLLPHQRVLVARLGPDCETTTLAALLHLTGSFLHGSGHGAEALPLFHRAVEIRERLIGTEHPYTLSSVHNLANCLGTLGENTTALPLLQRALESRERGLVHPAGDPNPLWHATPPAAFLSSSSGTASPSWH